MTDSLAFVVGWSGGFVLTAILFAPYLRKLGVYSVSDFLHVRFGGGLARFLGACVLLCCSFVILVAQLSAIGIIAARFLDLPFELAVAARVERAVPQTPALRTVRPTPTARGDFGGSQDGRVDPEKADR